MALRRISLSHFPARDGEAFFNDFWRESWAFSCSSEQLVRHFLGAALELDRPIFRMGMEEIRAAFLASTSFTAADVPAGDHEFVDYVLENCLQVDDAPARYMLTIYEKASEDLRAIERNLSRSKAQQQALTGNHFEVEYGRQRLEHWRRKNKRARAEIVRFLANGAKDEALYQARRRLIGWGVGSLLDFHVPYAFRWFTHRYDPDSFSMIRNKLGDEAVSKIPDWERLCREDPAAARRQLPNFVAEHRVVERLGALLQKHHRLAARRDALSAALEAFRRGDFVTFYLIAPLQIEGIFSDLCLELGMEEEVANKQLRVRLDRLDKDGRALIDYEYFKFGFPIVRNRVAHGHVVDATEAAALAHEMLLDLFDVCHALESEDLPIARKVALLRSGRTDARTLAKLAALSDLTLPAFYELEAQEDEFCASLTLEGFWHPLYELAGARSPDLDAGLARIGTLLAGMPEHREHVDYLFRRRLSGRGRAPQELANEFTIDGFFRALDVARLPGEAC